MVKVLNKFTKIKNQLRKTILKKKYYDLLIAIFETRVCSTTYLHYSRKY